LKILNYSIS